MVEEKTESLSLIEQANAAAIRLENANMVALEANRAKEILLKREEELQNNRLLGGQSTAGQSYQPQISDEERIKIEARNYFKGGLLEKVLK